MEKNPLAEIEPTIVARRNTLSMPLEFQVIKILVKVL